MKNEPLPHAQNVIAAKGWDEITRQIMLAGKALPVPPPARLTPDEQVSGCQSLVYVWIDDSHEQSPPFVGWSDAKIIRGVLAILLEKANALSLVQIVEFDFSGYLSDLSMSRHLSQSRADGIAHVIARIKRLAAEAG